MKVYVITRGEYSDYMILAVAIDRKKAEKLAKLYTTRYDEAQVEEYETEANNGPLIHFDANQFPFYVLFNYLGEVLESRQEDPYYFTPEINYWPAANGRRERMRVRLYAPNQEAAIKRAAERRAEFLARREGLA